MSEMLDRAVAQAGRLPADRQGAIAALVLDAMEDERRRDAAFASSPEVLERLATQPGEEGRQRLAEELDPEAVRALDELMAEHEIPLRDSIDTDAARRRLPLPEPDGRNGTPP